MSKQPTNGEIAVMLKYMQESIDELHKKADYTNGQVRANTEYRLEQSGAISFFKWIGFSNLIAIIVLYFQSFNK